MFTFKISQVIQTSWDPDISCVKESLFENTQSLAVRKLSSSMCLVTGLSVGQWPTLCWGFSTSRLKSWQAGVYFLWLETAFRLRFLKNYNFLWKTALLLCSFYSYCPQGRETVRLDTSMFHIIHPAYWLFMERPGSCTTWGPWQQTLHPPSFYLWKACAAIATISLKIISTIGTFNCPCAWLLYSSLHYHCHGHVYCHLTFTGPAQGTKSCTSSGSSTVNPIWALQGGDP